MSSKSIHQVATYRPLTKLGMEELAARQRTVTPSGGILFARNADGEQKTMARQKVIDLFTRDIWNKSLNLFTLPGINWRFERKLLAAREPGWMRNSNPIRTHFTGAENDRAIYFGAVTQMPGVETPHRLIKPVKRDRFPFAEMAIKSRFASFFFANADDMLIHKWIAPSYRDIKPGWDGAWLDYTGPLTVERMARIKHFYENYVRDILIVTVLKARWDRSTSAVIKDAGGHSRWLAEALPGTILHDFEYFDTSPMAQFAVRH